MAKETIKEFPTDGVEMTILLVVEDLTRARTFYRNVLGATEVREYGGSSAVLRFQGTWLLLVTGGGPTRDKPTVTFRPPADPGRCEPRTDDPGSGLPPGLPG